MLAINGTLMVQCGETLREFSIGERGKQTADGVGSLIQLAVSSGYGRALRTLS
jgi:hypothetical protein